MGYMDLFFLQRLIDQEDIRQEGNKRPQMTPLGDPPFTTGNPGAPSERYPSGYVTVQPSNKKLRVRVHDTPASRGVGFKDVPDENNYDALLFKWPGDASGALHNRDVNFPVSAQWFDSTGMYVDHAHMLANDTTPRYPKSQHRYALEVNSRDWTSLGLGPGSRISMADEKDQSGNGSVQLGGDTSGVIQ